MTKTKGITIWEQHVEHFVLLLAVLVCAGLVAMQFLGDPNAVEVAGKGKVGPGDVDRILEEQALTISEKMSPDAPAPVPIPDPSPLLATFEAQRKRA